MKSFAVCLLLVALAAVSVECYRNQTRIIGNPRAGDWLLDRVSLYKQARPNYVVVSNYRYPRYGSGRQIHCIKVFDRDLTGFNGDVYLNKGGLNQYMVDMSIRSKIGYGIKYDVEIWGN